MKWEFVCGVRSETQLVQPSMNFARIGLAEMLEDGRDRLPKGVASCRSILAWACARGIRQGSWVM